MLRKDANLNINDRASIYFKDASDEIRTVITKMDEDIKRDTLSDSLEFVSEIDAELTKEVKIDAEALTISLKKNNQ